MLPSSLLGGDGKGDGGSICSTFRGDCSGGICSTGVMEMALPCNAMIWACLRHWRCSRSVAVKVVVSRIAFPLRTNACNLMLKCTCAHGVVGERGGGAVGSAGGVGGESVRRASMSYEQRGSDTCVSVMPER